jgi:Gram-negative bacterial TonB protein C-terminal
MVSILRGLTIAIAISVTTAACASRGDRLCSVLEAIGDGELRKVTLTGLFVGEPELTVLYDPNEPRCGDRVQPAVWVEFDTEKPTEQLKRILNKTGRAMVVVTGELHGPGTVGVDVPSLQPSVAAAVRVSKQRYGHMGQFRAKLVVQQVVHASEVNESVPQRYEWRRQNLDCLPRVVNGPFPMYPKLARTAGVTGEVVVRYTVVSGKVSDAAAVSGDRMLTEDAVRYIRELGFEPDVNAVLECRFVFLLERRSCDEGLTPKVELKLPTYVKITGARHLW